MQKRMKLANISYSLFIIGAILGLALTTVLLNWSTITGLSIGTMSGTPTACDFGDNYSGTGDWIINQSTYCRDMIITLGQDGSIYLNSKVVFQNVTIQLDPSGYVNYTSGGKNRKFSSKANISMSNTGASLYMNATDGDGCKIESISDYNFDILIGSTAIIEDTVFTDIGWAHGGGGFYFGASAIAITAAANNVQIYDSTFIDSYGSLLISANNTIIQGCNFTNITNDNMRFTSYNITFVDNDYYDNGAGFGSLWNYVALSNFSNNRIHDNGAGFTLLLVNSTFSNNYVARTAAADSAEISFASVGFQDYISDNNIMEYNNITCKDNTTYGFAMSNLKPFDEDLGGSWYYGSNNSFFRYNDFRNCNIAFYMTGSNSLSVPTQNIVFEGNTFMNNTYGMYLRWITDSMVSKSTFIDNGVDIVLNATGIVHLVDISSSGLTGADAIEIQGDDSLEALWGMYSNTYALNASVQNITLTYGNLFRQWHVDVNVNSSSGSVTGANVSVYDKDGRYVDSRLTQSPVSFNLTEYNQTLTDQYFFSNFMINVTKAGYPKKSTTFNLTGNRRITFTTSTLNSVATSTSDWPMLQRDYNHSGYYPGSIDVMNLKPLWISEETNGNLISQPIISNNVVYYTDNGGPHQTLYARNALTGSLLWTFQNNSTFNTPAVSEGLVVFFTSIGDGHIYALNASTARQVWNLSTAGYIYTSPLVYDGIVYTGSGYNAIFYALDAFDGSVIWGFNLLNISTSPVLTDGRIFFNDLNARKIYSLNASNGYHIWNFSPDCELFYESAQSDGTLFVPCLGKVIALNITSGRNLFNFTFNYSDFYTSNPLQPAISHGRVFITDYNSNYTFAINETTGTQIWNYSDLNGSSANSGPVITENNILFFFNQNAELVALNASNGTYLWSYANSTYNPRTVSIANDIVYAPFAEYLFAFKSSPPVTSSPSGGSGGTRVSSPITPVEPRCIEDWNCGEWSSCSASGQKSRTCTPDGSCAGKTNVIRSPKPSEISSCAPQATCSDGITNQGETDTDCGGPCRPCLRAIEGPGSGIAPIIISADSVTDALYAGDTYPYKLSINNLLPNVPALLHYSIISLENGNIIFEQTETVSPQEASLALSKETLVPQNIIPGKYRLLISIDQDGRKADAETSFRVISWLWAYILFTILLLASIFLIFFLVGKRRKHEDPVSLGKSKP